MFYLFTRAGITRCQSAHSTQGMPIGTQGAPLGTSRGAQMAMYYTCRCCLFALELNRRKAFTLPIMKRAQSAFLILAAHRCALVMYLRYKPKASSSHRVVLFSIGLGSPMDVALSRVVSPVIPQIRCVAGGHPDDQVH